MRGALYARYSTDMQDQDSIEAQLRENTRFALDNNISIVKEYIDEAYSGKYDNRPAFQDMINDAKKGLFDCVIVHKVDRFARNKYDSAIYKAQIRRRGIKIYYSGQRLSDNAEGRLMEGILESMAEYYSENLANEVMKGMKTKANRGEFCGGHAPLGYEIVDKKYVVNEYEAIAIRMIFEMHSQDKTYDEIIKALKNKGYKSRLGNDFKPNSLLEILRNEKYAGIYKYNKAATREFGKRNRRISKPTDEIIIRYDVVPAIISNDIWEICQNRMAQHFRRGALKSEVVYLLSGLIKCSVCGRNLSGNKHSSTKNGKRYFYYKYRCYNKECKSVSVSKEIVENFVLEELYETFFTDEAIKNLVERMNEYAKTMKSDNEKQIKVVEKNLKRVEIEINNIVNTIAKGVVSEALTEKLKDLEQMKRDFQFEMMNTKADIEMLRTTENDARKYLEQFSASIKNKDLVSCKQFIGDFISYVSIGTMDEIEVEYKAPAISK